MATSIICKVQCSLDVAGAIGRGYQSLDSAKRYAKECELGSTRWLGPTRALLRNHGRIYRESRQSTRRNPVFAIVGKNAPEDEEDGENEGSKNADSEVFRRKMERMLGNDAKDARFEGKDLATLIRNKYGRSYDVQLVKKEFLGRQLLAMNVMWKYREQRSFPLTEEEYLLHLDYIAENLRGWGAVSYVRDSLEKTRERPRIGKAVSIFIEVDESGGRKEEWINR